jgi:thiamine-phosphate pyrophosphorylase
MKLLLVSPPGEHPGELPLLGAMFEAGLTRYDLRKPGWPMDRLATWLAALPGRWRDRVWLHAHHGLAADFRVGGLHHPDRPAPIEAGEEDPLEYPTSRACHDPDTLRASLGHYDSVCFGPVFPSVSKAGHGPLPPVVAEEARALLASRTPAQRRTVVFALSGITPARVPECRAFGFDGVAAIGTVWYDADPLSAFLALQLAARSAP